MSQVKSPDEHQMDKSSDSKELIMVIEDSAPNRKILCHLVEKLGFEVMEFENGRKALSHLMEKATPRLVAILSDVMMPEMDGISLLQEVRQIDKLKELPFVLVTAVSDKDFIFRAKSLNVSGYILKPVTFQRVESKLREVLPNSLTLQKVG